MMPAVCIHRHSLFADPWTPDVLVITGIVRESTGASLEDFKQDSILQQLPDSSPFKNLSHGHALA